MDENDQDFDFKVEEAKKLYTPVILVAIAENKMPDCFEVTRAGYVALAQLLVQALDQIELLINDGQAVPPSKLN